MIEITIDNLKIQANEGEYLLEVARANGIFIPAICYLSKCSPTLACKLCMVEADGKRVYACNTKIKANMNILTNTDEIAKERLAIMQSYCINHPLECGVCDKSGECELQDFTHLFNVNSQDFFIKDSPKGISFWSQVKYDPNLCILCERCVTTCKDNLGEANLKVIKQDSIPQVDAIWKEKMPKDAFSVWNRKQKGIIGFIGENACFDCAECASVCPVGALGVKSFQYTSNAWELEKIDSTCLLCPSGCKITYEGKKDTQNLMKIYRVTNDFNFNPICGAGRFAYDIYPNTLNNNINEAIEAIKKATYINVGGNITNNEARFLSILKEKFNIKLINEENRLYGEFLDTLAESKSKLTKLDEITQSKVIISIAGSIKHENPLIRYKINNTLKMQKDSTLVYAHPLGDLLIDKLSKKYFNLTYKPMYEDVALMAMLSLVDENILKELESYKININYTYTKEVKTQVKETLKNEQDEEKSTLKDIITNEEITEERKYYSLFEDANISYDDYLSLQKILANTTPLFIIGTDIFSNKNAKFLAQILSMLLQKDKIKLIINPPSANSNGIYKYLTLDSIVQKKGFSIGFRSKGDYVFDSINAHFAIPYFNAICDSMINIDNKILPILGIFEDSNYLQNLSQNLHLNFTIEKPKLKNYYANNGEDKRGINLTFDTKESKTTAIKFTTKENTAPKEYEINAYLRDTSPHFYPYTQYSKNLQTPIGIYVSEIKMQNLNLNLGIQKGDEISLIIDKNTFRTKIYVDLEMKGDFFAISPQISNIKDIFGTQKYLFVRIEK